MGPVDHCLKQEERNDAMDHATQVREIEEHHPAQLEFGVASHG